MGEYMDMTGVKVGDNVVVYDVNFDKEGSPGTVTGVGRKLFSVDGPRGPLMYRLEDGRRNDAYGHQWVKTVAQAEEDDRRKHALDSLRRCGLQFYASGREALYGTGQLEELAGLAVLLLEGGRDDG
jgi:hypothetical protein